MKRNQIKKVVLATLISSLIASPVMAIESGVSHMPIKGTAPVIKSSTTAGDHTITFTTRTSGWKPVQGTTTTVPNEYKHENDAKLGVGDWVILQYVLTDADGDPEGTEDNTNENIKFYFKDANDTWQTLDGETVRHVGNGTDTDPSWIAVQIPATAGGGKQLGYTIQEKTQYGYPAATEDGSFYSVPDIFDKDKTDLGTGEETEPTSPTENENGGGNTVDTDVLPVGGKDDDGEDVVIVSGSVRIFKSSYVPTTGETEADRAADYTQNEVNPKVGEAFKVYIFDASGNDITDSAYTNIKWALDGTDISAGSGYTINLATDLALLSALDAATDRTFTILNTPAYKNKVSRLVAGAQGFKLYVQADAKQ